MLSAMAIFVGFFLLALFSMPYLSPSAANYSLPVRAQVVESSTLPAEGLLDRIWPRHRYVYQGEIYASSLYRHGGGTAEAVRRYPVGSMATARIDPNRPEHAVMETGLWLRDVALLALGFILLVCGFVRFFAVLASGSNPASPRFR